jgi:rRNA maturation endonuclease Nob1
MDQKTNIGTVHVKRDRYKLCSNCGNFSHISEPQEFCMVCGTKFLMECWKCHEPILYPTATYCPACGNRLVNKNHQL